MRGSIPTCGKEFHRYGGNTTCLRIYRETANRIVIIDAGTGIRNLGKELVASCIKQNMINILFSHFHWDVTALPQHHKFLGGSYGFRIEDDSVVLVVCTVVVFPNCVFARERIEIKV